MTPYEQFMRDLRRRWLGIAKLTQEQADEICAFVQSRVRP